MSTLTKGGLDGAVARYRLLAIVVGIGLIVLVFVGMPLKYAADQPAVVAVVGTLHGYLYMVYLVMVFLLSRHVRWTPAKTIGIMLAGTVPFLGLVVEHYVTRDIRATAATSSG